MKRLFRAIALAAALLTPLPLHTQAAELLIPVGQVIGLQLGSDTLTVAAYDDTMGDAARSAGLKIGDELVTIGDTAIDCAEDVRSALNQTSGPVTLTVRRGSKLHTLRCPGGDRRPAGGRRRSSGALRAGCAACCPDAPSVSPGRWFDSKPCGHPRHSQWQYLRW